MALAFATNSVNAQEIWSAASAVDRSGDRPVVIGAVQSTLTEGIYAGGDANGPDTSVPGTLTSETITGTTDNVTLTIVSTPYNLSRIDVEDGKTMEYWSARGGEGNNEALTTDDCDPKFESCLMPKGNPTCLYWDYYEVNSDGNDVFRVGNTDDIYWTEGKDMPVKGAFIKIEPKAAGSLTLGVWVNKGNHPVYVVDAETKQILPHADIAVKFYYQNTGFAYKQETETNEFGEEVVVSQTFINEGTMPEDYILQHTNGETQNRPALGYITFNVEAGKTYYAFNPKSQLGCYGFKFVKMQQLESTDISQIDNVIYLEPQEVRIGTQATLSFKMKNNVPIRGFQFDLYLPEGMTAATSSNGRIQASLDATKLPDGDDHQLTTSIQTDGAVRFLCNSQNYYNFVTGDDIMMTLKVNLSDDMQDGDYPIELKKVKLSETVISNYYLTELVRSKVTVNSYVPGDVNGDGMVDISDYISVANFIHGHSSEGFVFKAGDIDSNGEIDITDYIGISNIIHSGSPSGNNQAGAKAALFLSEDSQELDPE